MIAPLQESITVCFTAVHDLADLEADSPAASRSMLQMLCKCMREKLAEYQGCEAHGPRRASAEHHKE